jgi:L-threonylcarbamoyladenylate synthase
MPQVSLSEFIAAVQAGDLVSFPTDTVPALASRPDRGDRIFHLKQRSQTKPLILMGANLQDLLPYVTYTPAELTIWSEVVEQHWPGPLTLVLPASDRVPLVMNPQQTGTIGIRVPNHPLARYLLERTGPMATTSINRSGQPPLETMTNIAQQFPEVTILSKEALGDVYPLLSGTKPPSSDRPQGSGLPSTVIRWQGQGWEILRQGEVQLTDLML